MKYGPGMPDTPAVLQRCFDTEGASAVTVQGDLALLDGVLTGFFCSVRCPGDIILKTYDLAQGPAVRAVICPARGLL